MSLFINLKDTAKTNINKSVCVYILSSGDKS